MRTHFLSLTAFLLCGFAYVQTATAQDEEKTEEAAPEEGAEAEKTADTEGDAAAADKGGEAAPNPADTSPVEEKGVTYKFVGLRYRGFVVPQFMQSLFGADGGTTVYAHNFGPEFIIRKDNFEYDLAITYASYAFDATPFKAKSDGEDAWELVTSEIKVLYFTSDFLWSHPFSETVAFTYGMGAGLGIVFGDLKRVQAYKDSSGDFVECPANAAGTGPAPVNPAPSYCGSDNNHYGDYTEPSWANGGSKPMIFPWIAGQFGFRFKPHKKFQARLDFGIAIGHVFFGLAGDYGL